MTDDTARIDDVLSTLVAPLVAKDGGTVRLVEVSDDRVTIALEGACIGCPARPITRDHFIVPLLAKELGRDVTVDLV